ncbi:hypothetical protein BDN72DRAFT_895295 [Pluteus cervinus]|uniref:Uncharacterized protein n=1 Tax=Pluteus cervinus TaxID=181527 RepID=A0ACD3B246_9AGAR|nr:hypothetical protein BDN72DRAFT_895295 [Pluteus cervinus]
MRHQKTHDLPHTIIDHILAHLADDLDALGNCGLVSRCWSSLSRSYFFNKINLHGDNVEGFYELVLCSRNSTFCASYVAHLCVDFHSCWQRSLLLDLEDIFTISNLPGGFPIIPSFGRPLDPQSSIPSVRTLEIENLGNHDENMPFQLWAIPRILSAHYSAVVDLRLVSVDLMNMHMFSSLIFALPNLECLFVGHCRLDDTQPPRWDSTYDERLPLPWQPPSKPLRRLEFSNDDMRPWSVSILYTLMQYGYTFSHVILGPVNGLELCHAVGDFLRFLGPTLRYLDLSSFNYPAHVPLLSEATHLQYVALAIELQGRFTWPNPLTWASKILEQVISEFTQSVIINVHWPDPQKLDQLDWESFAQVLRQPRFARLAFIQFNLDLWSDEAEESIRENCGLHGLETVIKVKYVE